MLHYADKDSQEPMSGMDPQDFQQFMLDFLDSVGVKDGPTHQH